MRKVQFVNGEIYHIYNRGVDKRDIFMEDDDYFRMVHSLFEFNDIKPVIDHSFTVFQRQLQLSEAELPKVVIEKREPRKLLVEVLVWCLMPNHYHLLLRQLRDNGITNFMHKLGTGYTNYFNEKNQRSGSLFQGRFKAIHVKKEPHFLHLPFYIHANPLDLIEPDWRSGKIKDFKKAMDYLNSFKWSSYLDYSGIKNYPSISQRDFLLDVFGGTEKYKQDFTKWLKEMKSGKIGEIEKLEEVIKGCG